MVTPGLHRKVLGLIPETSSQKVILNLGCEDFHQNNFDFPEHYQVHNCDINPAKRGVPNFTKCDLNDSWPYPDDWVDVVLSVEVIEHLESPWHHLREVRRVLKPGGILILTTPDIMCSRSREIFQEKGEFLWFQHGNVFKEPSHTAHINPIPKWELEYICMRLQGLEIREVLYHREINLVMVIENG